MILRAQGSYKIRPTAQPSEVTCWLACYAMMYQTDDRTADELLSRLKAAGVSTDATLKDADLTRAGDAAGFVSEKAAVLADFATVRRFVDAYGAFKASIGVNDSGHAVLVFAVDPDTESVLYYNPWSDDWTSAAARNQDVSKPIAVKFNVFKSLLALRKAVVGSLQRWP